MRSGGKEDVPLKMEVLETLTRMRVFILFRSKNHEGESFSEFFRPKFSPEFFEVES